MSNIDNTLLDRKRAAELASSEQVLLYLIENELGMPISKDNSSSLPFHIIIYNNAMTALAHRLGIEDGIALDIPILEFYRGQTAKQVLERGDILLAPDHIIAHPEWDIDQGLVIHISSMTMRINDFFTGYFSGLGTRLTSMKVEFTHEGEVLSITPFGSDN